MNKYNGGERCQLVPHWVVNTSSRFELSSRYGSSGEFKGTFFAAKSAMVVSLRKAL